MSAAEACPTSIDQLIMIGSKVRMSALWFAIVVAVLGGSASALAAPKAPVAPGDPKLVSVHPFTGRPGAAFVVTVRGSALNEATTVFLENAPFTAIVDGTEPA